MSKDNVLEISDFNVDFWVDGVWYPAVIDMNLGLAAGKVTAIVGESGSGKSTTALGLMSLLASNARMEGSIKVKGEEMLNAKASVLRQFRGKEVAYIFQEPMTALNPLFTIGYQIVETLRNHFEMGPKEAQARALELITMVDIPNPEQSILKYPHQLSGGQRQRAMIAQALACDPALLVADEPTTALDVTVQAEILDLMRGLKDKLNSAILLITHDMGVVADMADEILVMKDGITVEHGTADQIFNKPQHPYTQQLLGAVPKLGSTKKRELPYKESAKPDPVLKLTDVTIEYPKRGRQPAFTAVQERRLLVVHQSACYQLKLEASRSLAKRLQGLIQSSYQRFVVTPELFSRIRPAHSTHVFQLVNQSESLCSWLGYQRVQIWLTRLKSSLIK
jgi:peptide/nickel transport system ATP-binding protein